MAKNYVYKSKLYEVLKAQGMRLSGDAIDAAKWSKMRSKRPLNAQRRTGAKRLKAAISKT
jgi:hypothetical protein